MPAGDGGVNPKINMYSWPTETVGQLGTSSFEVSTLWRSNIIDVNSNTLAIHQDASFYRSLGYLIIRLNPVQQIGSTAAGPCAACDASQKSCSENNRGNIVSKGTRNRASEHFDNCLHCSSLTFPTFRSFRAAKPYVPRSKTL